MIYSMHSRHAMFVGMVALILLPAPLLASITTFDSDVFPPYPGVGDWTVAGSSLRIGNTLDGRIQVDGGSRISVMDDSVYFGFGSSAEGIGLITGGGVLEAYHGLVIGAQGTGILDVNDGSTVVDPYALLGMLAGSAGTVRVTDADTLWITTGALGVGGWGTGNLRIADGAVVGAADVFIGGLPITLLGGSYDPNLMPNGTGTVTVSGEGSRLLVMGPVSLYVGFHGTGTLDVNDGGLVAANLAVFGGAPDANGVVTVRDANSTLDVTGAMVVGAWGQGHLMVANGGAVSADVVSIGGFDADEIDLDPDLMDRWGDPNGTGTVTVTGAGSHLTVPGASTLYVGYGGTGTLNILDGGHVESLTGVVGALEGSTGRVLVDGEGSTWSITGGEPPMEASGDGDVIISNGGLVDVNGVNAILNVGDSITVGADGQGTLLIANGGIVFSATGIVGGHDPGYETLAEYFDPNAALGTGTGSVTVTGEGSMWYSPDLVVGFSHNGTLTVSDGGRVYNDSAFLGLFPGAVGTATVTGPESYWAPTVLAVGGWGQGYLTIAGGAHVDADEEVFIGGLPLQMLGEDWDPNLVPNGAGWVRVTGPGSQLEVGGEETLYVGFSGNGTLDVNEGGQVYAESAVVGADPGVNGVVTVHDTDSYLRVDTDLNLGAWGRGELTVAEGASAEVGTLTLGGFDVNEAFLDPNMVAAYGDPEGTGVATVTGSDSYLWAGEMVVAYTGQGTLNVRDAGYVETGFGVVGLLPGSQGQVVVDGNDSTWLTNTAVIGMYGRGSLTVSNGGYASSADSYVGGYDPAATDPEYLDDWGDPNGTGTILVTGAGSTWGNAGTLYLGYAGDGQMTVQAGGTVADERALLGFTPDSIGQAHVTGPNSVWQHSEDLVLGARGIGTLSVAAGGTVQNRNAYVGGFDPEAFGFAPGTAQGTGAVLVSGTGSHWTNTGDLLVGYYGTGTVDINDGGHVSSVNGYIGHEEDSQGAVHVAGTDSLWELEGSLYLGGDAISPGGTGLLSVRDGGRVSVGETLWIRPAGTLMGDGTVEAEMVDNYGTIAPGNSIGTLTIDGDVKFEPNSVFEVEISASGASDKLVATGDVDIVGGTVSVATSGTLVGSHEYEIIEANSVTGTFDTIDTALLHFRLQGIGLNYDPNAVWLWIDATRFDDPNIWRTNNEREVGEALQQIAEGSGTEVTEALQQLDDFNDVRQAYDQLAGQSRPPLAPVTVSATSKFLGTVTNRAQTLQTGLYAMSDSDLFAMSGPESGMDGGRVGQAPRRGRTFAVGRGSKTLSDRKWGVWGQGYGLSGDRETAEAGVPGYTYSMYGGSMGADYQFSETFLLGLVGGYSAGAVEFANLRDNTDITATHFGAYGSFAWDKWYADAVASYVGLKYDTERFVDLLSERLTGSFDGTEIAGYVEAGYNWDVAPNTQAQPLASVQYTHLSLDSYTESGGASALAFDEQTYDSIKGSLGARVTQTLVKSAGDFRADLQLRGRWVHEFGDNHSTVDTAFVNSPAAVFTVEDKAISRESIVVGAGLYTGLNKQTRVYLDYDARLNNDESISVFSAALQYRW